MGNVPACEEFGQDFGWLGGRWFQRRFEEVDTYYDREEDGDPLVTGRIELARRTGD